MSESRTQTGPRGAPEVTPVATGGPTVVTMRRQRSASRRSAVPLPLLLPFAAAVVVVAAVNPAFASSRGGPAPAGESRGAISGFTVSDIRWVIGDRGSLESVGFRLTPGSARSVRVRLPAGGPWLACSVAAGRASCPFPGGTSAAAADELSVLAAS